MLIDNIAKPLRRRARTRNSRQQENPAGLGLLMILGALGVGGYVAYRMLAEPKMPTPGPGPGPDLDPVGPPVGPTQPPMIYVSVERCGTAANPDACVVSDEGTTVLGDPHSLVVRAEKLPVDVLVSLPSSGFAPSEAAMAGDGAILVDGQPGSGHDFLFRVSSYATSSPYGVDSEDFSALVTANWSDINFDGSVSMRSVPIRVYVLRP